MEKRIEAKVLENVEDKNLNYEFWSPQAGEQKNYYLNKDLK